MPLHRSLSCHRALLLLLLLLLLCAVMIDTADE